MWLIFFMAPSSFDILTQGCRYSSTAPGHLTSTLSSMRGDRVYEECLRMTSLVNTTEEGYDILQERDSFLLSLQDVGRWWWFVIIWNC